MSGLAPSASGDRPWSVVIVDDQPMIRAGLRMIVDHEPDFDVVGEAGDGLAAIEVVSQTRPDVVLMDIRMPLLDGIEATGRLTADHSVPAVLVLTTFDDEEYVLGALRAGASGFLLKDATPEVLLHAIRTVAEGHSLVDPSVTRLLIERSLAADSSTTPLRSGAPRDREALARCVVAGSPPLTEREIDTWQALAEGRSNKEIAAALFVSEATVKTHVSAVMSKLGVASRVQAVVAAYDAGLVVPQSQGPGA